VADEGDSGAVEGGVGLDELSVFSEENNGHGL
jgi:hypothetical protein